MPQKNYLSAKKKLPRIETDEVDETEEVSTSSPAKSKLPLGVTDKTTFSLYVRGAKWIKDRDNAFDRLKELNTKIIAARHPRQKHVDYCFIDFASASDRDQALEELKACKEIQVKPITKDVPKLVSKHVQKVAERREAKKESRKILREIKLAEKRKAKKANDLTNQILITNLPVETTTSELKEQFEDVVDVNMKLAKKQRKYNSAILTFATPQEASQAAEKVIEMHGRKLNIILNSNKFFIKQKKLNKRKQSKAAKEAATETGEGKSKKRKTSE